MLGENVCRAHVSGRMLSISLHCFRTRQGKPRSLRAARPQLELSRGVAQHGPTHQKGGPAVNPRAMHACPGGSGAWAKVPMPPALHVQAWGQRRTRACLYSFCSGGEGYVPRPAQVCGGQKHSCPCYRAAQHPMRRDARQRARQSS